MLNKYKRQAKLLDDGVMIDGYVSKRKFYPSNKSCGFSFQKFNKNDIDKIIFFV
ncbi:MAG: hypothetical protein ACRCVJ_11690 [Clostridium sp.]|uniref:hypothetical protein n=1 Tax=Clostridium sp. TaxID=1506 RepID=UPI003F2A3BAE